VLNGPNVCKDFLLNQDGCRFTNRGEGRKCFYSHDLSQAGLPLHNREQLVEHLSQLEAAVYGTVGVPGHILKGLPDQKDGDDVDRAHEKLRCALLDSETRRMAFETAMQTRADAEMARARSGETTVQSQPSPPAILDVKRPSGANILKACGMESAFRDQKESRETYNSELEDAFIALALNSALAGLGEDDGKDWKTDEDDDLEGSGYDPFGFSSFGGGFSEDDMMELACQGVKLWDDDASAVLAALRGVF